MSVVEAARQAGYTSHTAPKGVSERIKRARVWLAVGALFLIIVALVAFGSGPKDFTPWSINNTTDNGSRAVAQILREQGVAVKQVERLSSARITDPANTTLVVVGPWYLQDYQVDGILDYPGDVVFVGVSEAVVRGIDPAYEVSPTEGVGPQPAGCSQADALAAGSIGVGSEGILVTGAGPDDLCFLDHAGTAAYLYSQREGRAILQVIAAENSVTNAELDEYGNAALILRSAGRHDTVVWYLGSPYDNSRLTWSLPRETVEPGMTPAPGASPVPRGPSEARPPSEVEANPSFTPPATSPVLLALVLAVLVAALWRARRFGPLVTEPLPVVVRSSESTRGRARLYRKARSTGRATAAIRAAAALRIGKRLGVPRGAGQAALVGAAARASGRSVAEVEKILYGPAPQSEDDMMELVATLDALESEVHRP